MLGATLCTLVPLSLKSLSDITFQNIHGDIDTTNLLSPQLLRLQSRCGGLLEAVPRAKIASDFETQVEKRLATLGSSHESENYLVQFIHQTVKEYIGKHQYDLGLQKLSLSMQRQNGYFYLLTAGIADWAVTIKPHIFTYAKLYEESLSTNKEIDLNEGLKIFKVMANVSWVEHTKKLFEWRSNGVSSLWEDKGFVSLAVAV